MKKEDMAKMLMRAYEALYEEYVHCPWCVGRIGYNNETHADDCDWIKFAYEYGLGDCYGARSHGSTREG